MDFSLKLSKRICQWLSVSTRIRPKIVLWHCFL